MLRKLQFIFFTCQKLILAHFCKLSYKDRDLWWPNKYKVACFSQFFPSEVKKILRKSQPQIREKLRKLSLKKKSVFLIKKNVYTLTLEWFLSCPLEATVPKALLKHCATSYSNESLEQMEVESCKLETKIITATFPGIKQAEP